MANFINPKVSLNKSWKFTPHVLVLIIIGIIIILAVVFLIWFWLKKVPPQPEFPPPSEEKTMEERLKELSVPEEKWGTAEEPSPEKLESLTPPPNEEVPGPSEETLKELSP